MEAPRSWRAPACVIFVLALVAQWWSSSMAASCSFTISNHCAQTIWPATLAGAGTPQLATTGFRLDPGQSVQVPAPAGWSGRIWARTGCDFSGAGGAAAAAAAGAAACQTGDCGGRLECGGTGATPPATLFEVTLGKVGGGAGAGDLDYYDVSLVDGYNLPVVAVPQAGGATGGGGGCATTGCTADLNRCGRRRRRRRQRDGGVPERVRGVRYGTPAACRPTAYSAIFKTASPSPANGQNGAGGSTPPPAGNNGAGISSYQPPPTEDINGAGSADQPAWMTMPSSASKRMMPSSSAASTRHNQLWSLLLLLPALLLFHFKQELL
uniref:Thaumatin-like protein n=1 Tax=Oryza rufipogon TaxID=4529 RepID=A0A0E0QL89_ORYRU